MYQVQLQILISVKWQAASNKLHSSATIQWAELKHELTFHKGDRLKLQNKRNKSNTKLELASALQSDWGLSSRSLVYCDVARDVQMEYNFKAALIPQGQIAIS
jgi:hypothetical protein